MWYISKIQFLRDAEHWLLENVFQKFSDFTHRTLRLTNFFWAVCSFLVSFGAFMCTAYAGLVWEHDPAMILVVAIMLLTFFPPSVRMIKKARLVAYDDAIYGANSRLKRDHQDLRVEALGFTLFITCMWLLISLKHGELHLRMLILWTSMMQYPTYSFCSCTPPGRRY